MRDMTLAEPIYSIVVVVGNAIEYWLTVGVETYYKLNMTIPVLNLLPMDLEGRFDTHQLLLINALYLVSVVIKKVTREQKQKLLTHNHLQSNTVTPENIHVELIGG